MINFEFTRPNEENPEGRIKISVDYNASEYYSEEQFPLRLIHKTLMGEVEWSSDLRPGWFSEYLMNTYTTIEIIDFSGNKLFDWKWDPFVHGDYAHQYFEIWALNNRGANGIAIGTHNGMYGEWVGPVDKGLLKSTLVEASDIQFNDLLKYYGGKSWVECKKKLITPDGSDVVFHEGGNGFTNSISREIIENYVGPDYITSTLKSSISINDLIRKSSERGRVRWIHIDVEGMDGDLAYSISEELLPDLLLFESLHMNEDYYRNLRIYLEGKGYSVTRSGWNTICTK